MAGTSSGRREHEQTSSQPVSTKHRADIDVTFDDLRSSLENTSECYLCGNAEESLMSYFRNFDTIGLISLNDWYVIDFPLKNYDENGNEVESATSTSFLSGNTGEISYSFFSHTPFSQPQYIPS